MRLLHTDIHRASDHSSRNLKMTKMTKPKPAAARLSFTTPYPTNRHAGTNCPDTDHIASFQYSAEPRRAYRITNSSSRVNCGRCMAFSGRMTAVCSIPTCPRSLSFANSRHDLKTRVAEMAVGCERSFEPQFPHHNEARAVGDGKVLVLPPEKPHASLFVSHRINPLPADQ